MATDYDAPRKTDDELAEDSIEELKARRVDKAASSVDVDEVELAENLELPGADLSDESLAAVRALIAAQWQQMASEGRRYPWFAKEQARTQKSLQKMMKAGIDVPVPRDKGGGRTHEQHKRNYQALLAAGTLFRLTGDRTYVDYARDMLLQYAQLYPTLGPHPEGRGQIPGRVFWQVLNDSVWLVNAIQGYDAIRDVLSAEEVARFEAMAEQSVHDQRAIETADTMPFEIYRQEYVSPERLGRPRSAPAPQTQATALPIP